MSLQSQLDHTRGVCRQLLTMLAGSNPQLAAVARDAAVDQGLGWLVELPGVDTEEVVPAAVIARRYQVKVSAVHSWKKRGRIRSYTFAEVERYQSQRNGSP